MAYVISDRCVDQKDQSCVEVCPVECIHPSSQVDGEDAFVASRQLYINPEICIDCGACEPACPVGAIMSEEDLSQEEQHFKELNRQFYDHFQ